LYRTPHFGDLRSGYPHPAELIVGEG